MYTFFSFSLQHDFGWLGKGKKAWRYTFVIYESNHAYLVDLNYTFVSFCFIYSHSAIFFRDYFLNWTLKWLVLMCFWIHFHLSFCLLDDFRFIVFSYRCLLIGLISLERITWMNFASFKMMFRLFPIRYLAVFFMMDLSLSLFFFFNWTTHH